MSNERLVKYPRISEGSDFEQMGLAGSTYIKTKGIDGKIVVYIEYSKRDVILGKWERDIVICGYRRTQILSGKKIQLVPEEEREVVKDGLFKVLSENKREIKSIKFW